MSERNAFVLIISAILATGWSFFTHGILLINADGYHSQLVSYSRITAISWLLIIPQLFLIYLGAKKTSKIHWGLKLFLSVFFVVIIRAYLQSTVDWGAINSGTEYSTVGYWWADTFLPLLAVVTVFLIKDNNYGSE